MKCRHHKCSEKWGLVNLILILLDFYFPRLNICLLSRKLNVIVPKIFFLTGFILKLTKSPLVSCTTLNSCSDSNNSLSVFLCFFNMVMDMESRISELEAFGAIFWTWPVSNVFSSPSPSICVNLTLRSQLPDSSTRNPYCWSKLKLIWQKIWTREVFDFFKAYFDLHFSCWKALQVWICYYRFAHVVLTPNDRISKASCEWWQFLILVGKW